MDNRNNFKVRKMEGIQIPNANDQPVTVAAFSAKFRSKREIYQFLTLDVRT